MDKFTYTLPDDQTSQVTLETIFETKASRTADDQPGHNTNPQIAANGGYEHAAPSKQETAQISRSSIPAAMKHIEQVAPYMTPPRLHITRYSKIETHGILKATAMLQRWINGQPVHKQPAHPPPVS